MIDVITSERDEYVGEWDLLFNVRVWPSIFNPPISRWFHVSIATGKYNKTKETPYPRRDSPSVDPFRSNYTSNAKNNNKIKKNKTRRSNSKWTSSTFLLHLQQQDRHNVNSRKVGGRRKRNEKENSLVTGAEKYSFSFLQGKKGLCVSQSLGWWPLRVGKPMRTDGFLFLFQLYIYMNVIPSSLYI